jgi:thioredoxin-like negative regulator of GroEL
MTRSALGIVASIVAAAAPAAEPAPIPWTDRVQVAFEQARATGKPVFVDAWAVWCAPCKQMDETTYRDPEVVEAMTGFVPLKVDHDASENFCTRHDIEFLPLVLFLDADGDELGRREGLQSPAALLAAMGSVTSGYADYRDAIARARESAEAAETAARYLVLTGNPGRASDLLRRALKSAPPGKADALALGLAEAQLGAGEARAASAAFARLADAEGPPEIRARALEGLVRAERERGRAEEAALALARLAAEFPDRAAGLAEAD